MEVTISPRRPLLHTLLGLGLAALDQRAEQPALTLGVSVEAATRYECDPQDMAS